MRESRYLPLHLMANLKLPPKWSQFKDKDVEKDLNYFACSFFIYYRTCNTVWSNI